MEDLEAAGRMACAADADHGRELLPQHRRLAADDELRVLSLGALILAYGLAVAFTHPPEWVSRARETGEQLLWARLFEFLVGSAFANASVLVVVVALCVPPLWMAPTERALATARGLFVVALAFHAASVAVVGTASWGATASSSSTVAASAVVAWFYADAESKALPQERRLAAGELKHTPLRAVILILVLAPGFAHPLAWVARAHETGEQLLRARLFELLLRLAFLYSSAPVAVVALCVGPPGAAPAERALAAARRLHHAALAFVVASAVVAGSESWAETAAGFSIAAASAAITWFYLSGELKGRLLGASFVGLAGCCIVFVWTIR